MIMSQSPLHNIIAGLIGRINHSINQLTNDILHHRDFQSLEASWRNIHQLTHELGEVQSHSVRIKLLSLSFSELAKETVEHNHNAGHSELHKKIYSDEFDHPGGEPYSVLLVDFEFHHKKKNKIDCVEVLRGLLSISSSSFCPIITGASSKLCQLGSWSECKPYHNYRQLFKQEEYTKWNNLAQKKSAQFLALTAPKTRVRKLYQNSDVYKENYFFHENSSHHSDYLWGNSAYRYVSAILASQYLTGWFLNIEQTLGNQMVSDRHQQYLNETMRTECLITDKLEQNLNSIGLMCIRESSITRDQMVYSQPSLHTQNYSNCDNQTYCTIPYLLCVCRIAQTLKFISRDKIGSFQTAQECETWMTNWLLKYSSSNDAPLMETQLKYPIHKSKVRVSKSVNQPGKYDCTINISPHTLIDGIETTLQLSTHIQPHFSQEKINA